MKSRVTSILLAMGLTLNCFSVGRADRCEKETNEKALLPPNLILSGHSRPLVEKIWRRSSTFRLQCERVSRAHWLKINLKFVPKSPWFLKYRALTVVSRRSGLASIEIYAAQDYVELIGHEIEHVLEQVEGVDLGALTAEKGDQAYRHPDGAFETTRAVNAGRKVKAEYIRAKSLDDPEDKPCSVWTMAQSTGGGRY